MSDTPEQPQQGAPGAPPSPDRFKQALVRHRQRILVGGMAVALALCAAFTVVRPTVTSMVSEQVSATPAAGPSAPPTSITITGTDRKGSAEPGRNNIATMRQQLTRVQAKASRQARIINSALDVTVAYFNMLGCYHTDRDEPHYGFMAYHFGSCGYRMPQQYAYLDAKGVTIAGVGEFQGKAWRVLAGINDGRWDIYPRGQSGPNGQNPVVWRSAIWQQLAGEQIHIPYNCANGGTCRGTSTLVLLQHRQTGRKVYVLNTHHASDGGGGGASRRAAATGIELGRLRSVAATGIPVIYMGDFNSGPGLHGTLTPGLGGMGIDQIWGTSQLTFDGGHYDGSFGRWTDHGHIVMTTATIPGVG